eukprot:5195775-Amphidinium_carterae.1
MSWCISNIEPLLRGQQPRAWTSQWLDVLKAEAKKGSSSNILNQSQTQNHRSNALVRVCSTLIFLRNCVSRLWG